MRHNWKPHDSWKTMSPRMLCATGPPARDVARWGPPTAACVWWRVANRSRRPPQETRHTVPSNVKSDRPTVQGERLRVIPDAQHALLTANRDGSRIQRQTEGGSLNASGIRLLLLKADYIFACLFLRTAITGQGLPYLGHVSPDNITFQTSNIFEVPIFAWEHSSKPLNADIYLFCFLIISYTKRNVNLVLLPPHLIVYPPTYNTVGGIKNVRLLHPGGPPLYNMRSFLCFNALYYKKFTCRYR